MRTFYLFGLMLASLALSAQSGLSSAGGELQGSGGSASFSLGLVNYRSFSGPAGALSEGLQQAFDAEPLSELELPGLAGFALFPNPSAQDFFLSSSEQSALRYRISRADGQVLREETWQGGPQRIHTQGWSKGLYFLSVWRDGQLLVRETLILN